MADIVVIDPSPAFSRQLGDLLYRFNDRVLWLREPSEAAAYLDAHSVDTVIADSASGIERVCEIVGRLRPSARPPLVLLSEAMDLSRLLGVYRQGVSLCIVKPFHVRELLSSLYALLRRQRRIVCLGGGTGLYTLLLGLKMLPDIHLTSVVGMSDDGGSAGRIREAFGGLPPGDGRRSLVALSSAPRLMNDLMQYRFKDGAGLKDHNLGNLLLAAVADLRGSMEEAVRTMGDILNVQGIVLPVTSTLATLVARMADGSVIRGEHRIDVPEARDPNLRIEKLWQEPEAVANPEALSAILAADVLTIGPGDLFTSIIATLIVRDLSQAIRASRAQKLYVCNLMTKPGETGRFTVEDHVQEVVRYIGADVLDAIMVSNTPLSPESLRQYAAKDQEPVRLGAADRLAGMTKAKLALRDVGSERELVRHDSAKLASEIGRQLGLGSSGAHAPD